MKPENTDTPATLPDLGIPIIHTLNSPRSLQTVPLPQVGMVMPHPDLYHVIHWNTPDGRPPWTQPKP